MRMTRLILCAITAGGVHEIALDLTDRPPLWQIGVLTIVSTFVVACILDAVQSRKEKNQ